MSNMHAWPCLHAAASTLLAFLPSLVLTIDTCNLVCQDKEFLHNSCYDEVCVLLQPGHDRCVMSETKGERTRYCKWRRNLAIKRKRRHPSPRFCFDTLLRDGTPAWPTS